MRNFYTQNRRSLSAKNCDTRWESASRFLQSFVHHHINFSMLRNCTRMNWNEWKRINSFLHHRPLASFNKSTSCTLAFFFPLLWINSSFWYFLKQSQKASKSHRLNNPPQIPVPQNTAVWSIIASHQRSGNKRCKYTGLRPFCCLHLPPPGVHALDTSRLQWSPLCFTV